MEIEFLKNIIKKGEGISVEFKKSHSCLNKSVFESVCAFLNRNGGHIFLGIDNKGSITGIEEKYIASIINNFVTLINNPQKLSPTFYLSPNVYEIDGKKIIYILVPESSQVHKTAGKIFDRNNDGDFNVTENPTQISQLYLRKQSTYSENTIFPYTTLSDLRYDLIERIKIRAKNENSGSHPWFEMSHEDFLLSAQLYRKDLQSGKAGFTLAAILLFGKDETILNAVPHYKTDALLRRENIDRFDDRDLVQTNLIESYERLMTFIAKHIPDPYYLEGDTRISLRNKIFREVIVNLLIHREYKNAFPAKMIIEKEKVYFENANRPHGYGNINPASFIPFPKNPVIARVFREIGLADELGSGVRNLFKYTRLLTNGAIPQLIEEDIFKTIIPINMQGTMQGTMQDTMQDERTEKILRFCITSRSREEIQKHLGINNRDYFRKEILNPLLESGSLKRTIQQKPNSPNQKYITNILFIK